MPRRRHDSSTTASDSSDDQNRKEQSRKRDFKHGTRSPDRETHTSHDKDGRKDHNVRSSTSGRRNRKNSESSDASPVKVRSLKDVSRTDKAPRSVALGSDLKEPDRREQGTLKRHKLNEVNDDRPRNKRGSSQDRYSSSRGPVERTSPADDRLSQRVPSPRQQNRKSGTTRSNRSLSNERVRLEKPVEKSRSQRQVLSKSPEEKSKSPEEKSKTSNRDTNEKSGSRNKKNSREPESTIRNTRDLTQMSNKSEKRQRAHSSDSDGGVDRKSNTSQKSKAKKKSQQSDKDDSLENSFERSKKFLGSHSSDFDIPEPENVEFVSPSELNNKKPSSKRQRLDTSSDTEILKQRKDKNDSLEESRKTSRKKKQKKDKLDSTNSSFNDTSSSPSPKKTKKAEKSPSARERSGRSEVNTSRFSDRSVGRKHDMAQFESEPESGELTDSEDEIAKGPKAVRSFVSKPSEEFDPATVEDERFLNAKRKAEMILREKQAQSQEDRASKRKADPEPKVSRSPVPKKPKPADAGIEALTGRTGGAYIPPARLRAMQANITDKSSVEFQRISWEALKKSINGLVNKVNVGNIENIVREIFQENIVRGKGLMARSIIQAQAASPTFTHVYAALVAIVNTKFPQNGELVLKRLIIQFRRGYKRNDKSICLSATRFIAHLVNQQVAHEVLSLEILTLLLETPTDDSVEVAIGFLKECGQKLTEVSPRGINAIFERLRTVLHEGQIELRVQYMVEVMFAVRKDNFKDFPAIVEDLDLVEEEDQFTHLLTLEDAVNPEDILNVFKPDPQFQENEEKYAILKKEILGEGSSDEEGESGSGSGSDSESDSDNEEEEAAKQTIIDQTETNLVALKRTIYLTIQSSLDFEECAHKLMKMELKPGQEVELCYMILDCCAQMRTYEKFFGLLAGRFCMLDRKYVEPFQAMFKEQYETIHRLETNKLRNVAKFFAHLLFTDSISWAVVANIKLNEDDTTSASRIFIKILFQELSEYLGLPKLNDRLKDPTLQEYYAGLMPRDNPRDTRFAINFFTTIGLGGLTDDLREHLKNVSKKLMQQKQEQQELAAAAVEESESSGSSEESNDESDDSSNSDSSSESESADEDPSVKRKKDSGKTRPMEKTSKKKESPASGSLNRNIDRANGKHDRNGRIDEKKNKKKPKQPSQEDVQREQEEKFRKLAKLANYGDIDNLPPPGGFQEEKSRKKAGKKEKRKQKDLDSSREEFVDSDAIRVGKNRRDRNREQGDVFSDGSQKNRDREEKGSRRAMERSYEKHSSPDSSDALDARNYRSDRNSGRDDRNSRRDDSFGGSGDRDNRRGVRDGRDDRQQGRGEKGDGKRKERKDKDRPKKDKRGELIVGDKDDARVHVERTFERLDIYEDKFEKERQRNLEMVRDREEYHELYQGRDDRRGGRGEGGRDDREGISRGGRGEEGDRFERGDERRRPGRVEESRRRR